MEYRILGPLEVRRDGRPIMIGRGKQRGVLALLLLHANEVVSVDRLVDELWPGGPPPTATKIVQNYIWQIRRALGDPALETDAHGYVLRVGAGDTDVDQFRELVSEARRARASNDDERAGDLLRRALALWRGPPLADFAYDTYARGEIARLEELRLAALMDRIDADLALGRHADVVGELEALIADHPLQERLRGQLMLALYRSGRQADALNVYQETRRALAEELGLEPTQPLQQLEKAMLVHDPSLDQAPRRRPIAPPAKRLGRRPTERVRARTWLVIATAAVALAAAVAIPLLARRGTSAPKPPLAPNSVGVIDAKSGRIVDDVLVGHVPVSIAAGANVVYVLNIASLNISPINLRTRAVGEPIVVSTVNGGPTGIAVSGGYPWIVSSHPEAARQIDPLGGGAFPWVRFGSGSSRDVPAIAAGGGSIWVDNQQAQTVIQIAVATRRIVRTILVHVTPLALAVSGDRVWFTAVGADGSGLLRAIDMRTWSVTTKIRLPAVPSDLAVGVGAVWVAVGAENAVWRINPRTESVERTITVGDGPTAVAVGGSAVWVANTRAGTISRIDPRTNEPGKPIEVGGSPRDLVVAGGSVWVAMP